MRYHNYHKHDYYSNLRTPDCAVSYKHYIDRALELGHDTFFTTNHGISTNIFEVYDYAKERGIKAIYGVESYYTPDRHIKEGRNNYHLCLIALNKNGYRKINYIQSLANIEGYHYHPRIDTELLLTLPKDDVVITTACVTSPLFKWETYEDDFLIPMIKHFGDNFMLEVQNHNHQVQIEHNQKILELVNKYNLKMIHGNDSHYIYEDGLLGKDGRNIYLQSKKMSYDDEDSFTLDYPDYQTILNRYKTQGVLSEDQVRQAIENTLIFDKAEDLGFEKNIKMPNIYPELAPSERLQKLGLIIKDNFEKKGFVKGSKEERDYLNEIAFEFDIIKDTNDEVHTADYFLINEKICKTAINKYGGVLTETGRGSAVSFLINHLIGLTSVDRTELNVPMYPTRFISKARLRMKSLPDFDYNLANPEAFYKASEDILGKHSVYPMIAYGTLQNSSAFRMVCRYYKIPPEEYNDIAKRISSINSKKITKSDEYKKLLQDHQFGSIIKESEQFVGLIDSASIHPCAYLLLSDDIREEVGISKIGDNFVCNIDSYYSDYWKFLKNDYLRVDVVEIIDSTFKLIGESKLSIKDLLDKSDESVWKLYEDGITETLNQTSTDFAKSLIMRYKPKKIEELSAFVASIRPGFASLLENFIERKPYTNNVKELDDLLFASQSYLLYQESIMMYLQWLGMPEENTYDILKQIAKKKFREGELESLLKSLKSEWLKKGYDEDLFYKTWQVIEDASEYSFNGSHSACVSLDSLYCAYLKANYPLEYYSVTLNLYQGDIDKTHNLTEELNYFNITLSPIKFRHSKDVYTFDKDTRTIHKGIESIKYMNKKVSLELYDLRNNHYKNFLEVLEDIKTNTSCNSKQLDILIKLDFFREFGKSQYLLDIVELHKWVDKKQISKAKVGDTPFPEHLIHKYSGKVTDKTYINIDFPKLIAEAILDIENKSIPIKELIQTQKDFLGYVSVQIDGIERRMCYVSKIDIKHSPKVELYLLANGKTETFKINKKYFTQFPFKEGDIIKVLQAVKKPKFIPITDEKGKVTFEKSKTEMEWWIENYTKGMLE